MQMTLTNRRIWPILLLTLLGMGLRLGQLSWQPLWADEGYSIYFATEPLGRMVWLTANDIHPPLYYALLHSWTVGLSTTDPALLRLFSVIVALPAIALLALLAKLLFPGRPRLLILATLLLALNPMHLFYSQEVRMYGLAMTFSLASTVAFWQALGGATSGATSGRWRWWIAYIATATATLYTLYYSAFLLLAHLLWALWTERRQLHKLRPLLATELLIGLCYAPWVIYTATTLAAYIDEKVSADQDRPLDLLSYISRHLLAFLVGHLTLPGWPSFWRWGALVGLLLPLLMLLWHHWRSPFGIQKSSTAVPCQALGFFVLFPALIAFVLNRFLPFFPDGGERLLLFVLPYLLLLIAAALDATWQQWHLGKGALLLLLLGAGAGLFTFYRLPRYGADDYRPLVRQVVQQGNDEDTLLATFPWQVGLWRAYAPQVGLPWNSPHGPQVALVSERAVTWGEAVQRALEHALARGTLWFPALRSIGSTLPAEVDQFFATQPPQSRPVLLVDHWYGNSTLRAWRRLDPALVTPMATDFGPLHLDGAGVAPTNVAAANQSLRIDLHWREPVDVSAALPYGTTIRLLRDGHPWANYDLDHLTDLTGLIVPVGLPPGTYALQLGIVDSAGQLLTASAADGTTQELVTLATVTIGPPLATLLPARLPMRVALPTPAHIDGATLWGYTSGAALSLSGEMLDLTLFWQNGAETLPLRNLYVSLLDDAGQGVAGWEGWPLPDYPTTAWPAGALVQTPLRFALPPTLASGNYQLGVGLLDPQTGVKSAMVLLGEQAVRQRLINYTSIVPPVSLATPVQFGTHARLLGYALQRQGTTLTLELDWQVLQPLLPPHEIFVHLDDATGQTVAQQDGPPQTVNGPAPTGSWLPGEYLVTTHTLVAAALADEGTNAPFDLRIGLYLPERGVRLPTTSDGAITGDHVTIPLQP